MKLRSEGPRQPCQPLPNTSVGKPASGAEGQQGKLGSGEQLGAFEALDGARLEGPGGRESSPEEAGEEGRPRCVGPGDRVPFTLPSAESH